jgi:hypothetical protein
MRARTAQVQPDAAGVSQHDRTDTDEFVADRRAGGMRKAGSFQGHAPDEIARRGGILLAEMEKARGCPGNQYTGPLDRSHDETGPTLADLGLNKSQFLVGRRYNRAKKEPHRPKKGDQNDPLKTADRIAAEHGEFGSMIEERLPFNRKSAHKLMAIAENQRLSDVSLGRHLPASWGTLYGFSRPPAKAAATTVDILSTINLPITHVPVLF